MMGFVNLMEQLNLTQDFMKINLTKALHHQLRLACAVLLVSALSQVAHAEDWAHKDWAHHKKLGFDTTESGVEIKEDVAQLPLLVRLHSGNFTFSEAKPDGSDLRFFAADGITPLPFHLENFDVSNELANAWVTLPNLTANSDADSIVVAWGNPAATAEGVSQASFDAAQVFVFHFGVEGAAGAGASSGVPDSAVSNGSIPNSAVKDSTSNANHAHAAKVAAFSVKPVSGGPIGAAAGFDGLSRIDLPASASLKLSAASGFTFSAWLKPGGNDTAMLYAQRDGAATLNIGLAGGMLYAASGNTKVSATLALQPAIWQHLAIVASAGKVTIYVDGNEVANGALIFADMGGIAVIGEGLKGEMDEVTLAGVVRTDAYIKALSASQSADTPLLGWVEEEVAAEEISYAAILLGSVTLDGWLVIGLLIVMAIISVHVMVTKTMMLLATSKANDLFLDIFKDMPTELLTPGHPETVKLSADVSLKKSSIYHLYSIGLREVTHRFDAQRHAGVANSLSAAGLDAIRASLEASMVRENQRLNSGMVLLTIAISGGPFLGLLGTVVGVMITFAAIAAAGDVNVNAIAPGIAAALVATVAGLAVAIPALFGYNWLASQIKSVSADTQVFADEFLTKSAELYSAW